jgi:Fe-S-cluster-containing hydrogenase component 2
MKRDRHLFFSPGLCTGCRLCELICSQVNTGEYNPDRATIQILHHPDLGTSLVAIRKEACICGDGAEACAEMCSSKAVRFVGQKATPEMLKDREWMAAPILE